MNRNADTLQRAADSIKRSITLKIFTIGVLILLLLIPTVMIQNLIKERQSRRDSVVTEINGKWGGAQTITGPFLTVPYMSTFKDADGRTQFNLNVLHVLPEKLDISGEITPEVRRRSLFEAVLFNATLKITGNFRWPDRTQMDIDPDDILWHKASLSLGVTDMRGIQEKIVFTFNQSVMDADPGLKSADLAESGVSAPVKTFGPDKTNEFAFNLNLNGSEQIHFIPGAESNTVRIQSTWPSPSFNGAFLPIEHEVRKDGFTARWEILHLNRSFPQFWEGSRHKVAPSAFGVKLIQTADIYQKSMRLAKYSILFLFFTFAAFFFSEIAGRRKIHPLQYILVGLAILIFYTLVLSLSEYIHFNWAYLLSAASVVFIITGYARAILSDARFAWWIAGLLALLYGYLFIVLQLEDYALIMGSVGLFVILAAVMFLTRKINWYEIESAR